jgi:hypothetical protein
VIGSKDAVLGDIMRTFGQRVADGSASIFRSGATPVEMLDAMAWININALYHFPDEFKIQLAWLRQAPPDAVEPGWSFSQQLGHLTDVLADGIAAGEIRPGICSTGMLARYVITVQWIPENILAALGTSPRPAAGARHGTARHCHPLTGSRDAWLSAGARAGGRWRPALRWPWSCPRRWRQVRPPAAGSPGSTDSVLAGR